MKKIILLGLLFTTLNALGDEAFISDVQFAGSGCDQNEAVAVLSPDQHVVSLLFDNFIVEAGGENLKRNRKNCQIKLSLSAPENKRIVVEKIDYRGYAYVSTSGRMNFVSQYSFNIPSLGISSRIFKDLISKSGDVDEDLYVEQIIKDRILSRACGEDVELDIRTDLSVMVAHGEDEGYASIDSLDSGIDYHISYESCTPRISKTPRERALRRRQLESARMRNQRNLARQNERTQRRMRSPRGSSSRRSTSRVTRPEAPSQLNRENESSDRPNMRNPRSRGTRVTRPTRPSRNNRRRVRP